MLPDAFSAPDFVPALLALAVPLLLMSLGRERGGFGRAAAALICVGLGLRYLWWRWSFSMPEGQNLLQQGWAWVFLLVETASILSSLSAFAFMTRRRDRSVEADAGAASPLTAAPVDVFIATYDEGREILERTILGAMSIDHPDKRVWVLDDGARRWVRELAEDLGAHYVLRVKGSHAKAGKVNNGLREALSTGRRPAFVLLLDAGFVASRRILRRTLPLFAEADVGIVQTPQHFFNPDPIQSNLLCGRFRPDEQRFFFNHLQEAKDAWGAAFCCGTSAVFRVDALLACGGMATETVTQDMLTSFRMREAGYRTVFLNEQLSLGLAPEGLSEYISQRTRWCLGAIQQCYTRWSFAGRAPIGLANRLSALEGVLTWAAGFGFKILMVSAPMVYWWTGAAVIVASIEDMLVWLLPYMLAGMAFMAVQARNTVFPGLTDVMHLLASFAVVRTVAAALVKPWGHSFEVTAKGVGTGGITVQWNLLAPFALIGLLTLGGMLMNLSAFSVLQSSPAYALNMVWSVFNIAVLALACAVCVELPRRRHRERFGSGEAAEVRLGGLRGTLPCAVENISVRGALLRRPGGWPAGGMAGELWLGEGQLSLPFLPVRCIGEDLLAVRFEHAGGSRRALIRRLFAGRYNNEAASIGRAFAAALRRSVM